MSNAIVRLKTFAGNSAGAEVLMHAVVQLAKPLDETPDQVRGSGVFSTVRDLSPRTFLALSRDLNRHTQTGATCDDPLRLHSRLAATRSDLCRRNERFATSRRTTSFQRCARPYAQVQYQNSRLVRATPGDGRSVVARKTNQAWAAGMERRTDRKHQSTLARCLGGHSIVKREVPAQGREDAVVETAETVG